MSKIYNVHNTDGSEKNGGIKNISNPPQRPQVTPPPQKPQQPQKK